MIKQRRIFLICPVRNTPPEVNQAIVEYIEKLENQMGTKVFWATRDNPHENTDDVGTTICEVNREALMTATELHFWFDPKSRGSLFDFGMAFALLYFRQLMGGDLEIWIANPDEVRQTPEKSFQNILLDLAANSKR